MSLMKHKWSDEDVDHINIYDHEADECDNYVQLNMDSVKIGNIVYCRCINLDKDDALALARHFNLFDSDILVNEM